MSVFQEFTSWLKDTAWVNTLHWFGFTEQKLVSFMYPTFQQGVVIVKNDLLHDIIDGIPIVVAALSGGYSAALTAATDYIVPLLATQAIELEQHVIGSLANALIGQAKAALAQSEGQSQTV